MTFSEPVLTCLLFADVVDSTRLVERLGDARAAELWATHNRQGRALLAGHGGREIDNSDGFFMVFDETADAARFALAYHAALAAIGLQARVGLHTGLVRMTENAAEDVARGAKRIEVEGLAKPIAARLMALGAGGQTLLSASARAALAPVLPTGARIESHGHYRLKGIEVPVEVFEFGGSGNAFVPPADSDKAYRVVPAADHWQPLRDVRHNLPVERDAFIGRADELRGLASRLDAGVRLLTVIGPGGTGKTRFVRRYGRLWLGDWPGGVYFCDLSDAQSMDGICFVVASALGIPLAKGDPTVQLGHAIAGRGRCLVVLDNFEQVTAHAADSLGRWLDRAADAAFVVTSRERLHLTGEELLPLDPLPVAHEAMQLFEVRARAQRPGFAIVDANRAAVAEVVRLLDGLPLAIELAAARSRVLSPAQLVLKMRDRFQVLAGARGTAARQATLKAAIDWSWDLLAPWEQAALAQCSVFDGGFTMAAAEVVLDLSAWPEAPSAMDQVQALVDKSLLRTWVPSEQGRFDLEEPFFGMYLSIRAYAAQRLAALGPGATLAAHQRHGAHFAGFGGDEAIAALTQFGGVTRRRMLALELDNLVAACRRAVGRGDGEVAVLTYRALWQVLEFQGPMALGTVLGAEVLTLADIAGALRTIAITTHGRAVWRAGHVTEAVDWLEQALALARLSGRRGLERDVHTFLGSLLSDCWRMDEARSHLETAASIAREMGARGAEGVALSILGNASQRQGRMEQARTLLETSLAIAREVGNRSIEGGDLGSLAILHREQGRLEEALRHYDQALVIHREVGNRFREGIDLGNLSNVHTDLGQFEAAQSLREAALTVHREVGNRRSEGIVLSNLGITNLALCRFDLAQAQLDAALAIARDVRNPQSEAFVLGCLAELHCRQGRLDEALICCEDGLTVSRAAGDRRDEGMAYRVLGDIRLEQGRPEEAGVALRAGEALLRETGERIELARLLCLRGRADADVGDTAAAHAALAEAEAITLDIDIGADPETGLGLEIITLRERLGGSATG